MAAAFLALLLVIRRSPTAMKNRLLGKLMKALPDEDRAEITAVNVALIATLLGDRGDARKGL